VPQPGQQLSGIKKQCKETVSLRLQTLKKEQVGSTFTNINTTNVYHKDMGCKGAKLFHGYLDFAIGNGTASYIRDPKGVKFLAGYPSKPPLQTSSQSLAADSSRLN
jgi:hypothetical protein